MEFDDIWNLFCKFCLIVFILICINSLIGDFLFRCKYSFPHVSAITEEEINVLNEPIQTNLAHSNGIPVYGEKNKYSLLPQAKYSISGRVVAKNSNFWFRDIMRSTFDDVCLIDFGIVWGDLAPDKKRLHKHMKFKSHKTLGQARSLEWRTKPPYNEVPWDFNYMSSHLSHTHMIPANANIMGGLLKIKKDDIVKIDGYLVDIYDSRAQIIARTSMSRSDTNASSRGSGACEDLYVKQVQIGNKIYK